MKRRKLRKYDMSNVIPHPKGVSPANAEVGKNISEILSYLCNKLGNSPSLSQHTLDWVESIQFLGEKVTIEELVVMNTMLLRTILSLKQNGCDLDDVLSGRSYKVVFEKQKKEFNLSNYF